MHILRTLCVVAFLAAAVCADPRHGHSEKRSKQKPSEWLPVSQLQQSPAVEDLSVQKLEDMSLEEGSKALETIYHVSQINNDMKPTFAPSPSNIPVHIIKSNGQKVTTTLDKFANTAKEIPHFGNQEITIFITGLPANTETVSKANRNLEQAYRERYNHQRQMAPNSDDETPVGNFVIIDLGEKLSNSKRYTLMDIDDTGAKVGNQLVQLIEKCNLPYEIVHVVGQNMAAHVAGAAGKEFKRQTGKQLRRITALDPSKVYAKHSEKLTGLARGDAEFVDAIHTSSLGMGTTARVGNVDIFPNGPSMGVPGARNVIDASMRATDYFAESVRPGNERNFPAVEANSLENYKSNNGFGKRAYMGIALDKDLEGDYLLQVNDKSPFGKRASAQPQKGYHRLHKSLAWPQN